MNPDLAEYHVPVNADVPSVDAILVEEHDRTSTHSYQGGVGEWITDGGCGRELACDRSCVPKFPSLIV